VFSLFLYCLSSDLSFFPTRRSSDLRSLLQFHCVLVRRSLRLECEPELLAETAAGSRLGTVGRAIEMIDAQQDERMVQLTARGGRSEEHTSELQSRVEIVCRLLLEKK